MTMPNRRQWLRGQLSGALGLGLGLALPATTWATQRSQPRRIGRLLAVGGAEDRLQDRVILRRFVELCGGPQARILVMTAASGFPDAAWQGYEPVFRDLGVTQCAALDFRDAEQANHPAAVDQILNADGIFMSGGDQRRLMESLWETEAARAMHTAFHLRGCCIGGTSAGAAALSRQMLAIGDTPVLPQKEAVSLDIGLGFISNAIVDQHFSERRRLGRLLSALAQRPDMLGVGIDENTALLIERGRGIEIIGQGAVTLVDGRQMQSNFQDIDERQSLEMLNVRLHLLPAGHRYLLPAADRSGPSLPPTLQQAVELLVRPGPIRG